jgi:putative intracellular protease/amidase
MGGDSDSKRVLVLCGDYMEDLEAMVPYQALLSWGFVVDAVCPNKAKGDVCRTGEPLPPQEHSLLTMRTAI